MKLIKAIKYLASDDYTLRAMMWRWRMASRSALGRWLVGKLYATPTPHLDRDVFGMRFRSPIGLAAGFDRNAEMIDALSAAGFGFVEIGSVTPRFQGGSPNPRLHYLKGVKALLYHSQIASAGVEQVIENIKHRHSRMVVGCNIAKGALTSEEDAPREYLRMFRLLYQYVDYFTINICCNSFEQCYIPTQVEQIMAILAPLFEFRRGQNQYRPILIKISPDLSDEQIDAMTDIMLSSPLDGIVACGGTTGRHGLENSTQQMHSLGRVAGTISGPPIKARALEVVRRIHSRSNGTYPIIGCGGISSAEDARQMLEAGATLVQILSKWIYDQGKGLKVMNSSLNEMLRCCPITLPQENSDNTSSPTTIEADLE